MLKHFRTEVKVVLKQIVARMAPPTVPPMPGGVCGPASLRFLKGIPVLSVNGSSREMGHQHGTLLRSHVHLMLRYFILRFFSSRRERMEAVSRATFYEDYIPAAHREEMEGIAAGAGVPYAHIRIVHTFLDWYRAALCSTFVATRDASNTGEPVFGRNLEFPPLAIADRTSMVICYRPLRGKAYAIVAWPGFVGALSGMNEEGLALGAMEVRVKQPPQVGVPYTLALKGVLESCSRVPEAVEFLREARPTNSNNIMLCDREGRACVLEYGPTAIRERWPRNDMLFAANHFVLGRRENVRSSFVYSSSHYRYVKMQLLAMKHYGAFGFEEMKDVLCAVGMKGLNIQSMVFLPKRREMRLSVGGDAAAHSSFVRIAPEVLFGR